MTDDTIYTDMVQPRGAAYHSDRIKPWSHYREPIDNDDGHLHGESRRWGDASPQTQSRVIDSLIDASREAGLSARETAHILAIARIESGFNPDAAAGTTSASGLGQFIDRTGAHYGINNANRFDAQAQSQALVRHFIDNRDLARSRDQGEDHIYKYHHDGPSQDYGGLALSRREVAPYLDRYERFVEQRLTRIQGHAPDHAPTAQPAESRATTRSDFQQTMERMLPGQAGVDPHITGHYGENRGRSGAHGGTDFNYEGGQTGRNLQHPTVHAPIGGVVTFSGGQYGTVKIRDAQGNSHEILHLDSNSVQEGQTVRAGDPIGMMGGRGPNGEDQYAQHVHYQMRDAGGRRIDPEAWWNQGRQVETTPAPGALRHGDRSEDVRTLQQQLNQLGVRDAHGKALSEDGHFGDNTRAAVRAFQKAHALEQDGVVGSQTGKALQQQLQDREQAAPQVQRVPGLEDPGHPNHALHQALRTRLPSPLSDDAAAHVTAQAVRAGIDSPDKLRSVTLQDNTAHVLGTVPGFRASVDLSRPAPPAQESAAQLLATQATAQQQETERRVAVGGR